MRSSSKRTTQNYIKLFKVRRCRKKKTRKTFPWFQSSLVGVPYIRTSTDVDKIENLMLSTTQNNIDSLDKDNIILPTHEECYEHANTSVKRD